METLWLILQILLYLIGTLALFLTVLPISKSSDWWIRIGDFPRLQIVFVCLAVIVTRAVLFYPFGFFEWLFVIFLIIAVIYQIYRVFPYLPVYPKEVQSVKSVNNDEDSIRILISNVFMENEETQKLVDLINDVSPDVVFLAEVNKFWTDSVSEIEKDFSHTVLKPLDNTYGMALYSKLELVEPETKYIVEDDVPSIHTTVKLRSGREIKLHCLHPRPPGPTQNERSAERDAELLIVGKEIEKTDDPTIVCGDLNDVAWSQTTTLFQKVSGLLDPRIGRGLFNSFHAKIPFLRMPLDHVFHSNDFRLIDIKRMRAIGSDHFPIFIALNYQSDAESEQKEPDADLKEEIQAEEKIREGFEKNS